MFRTRRMFVLSILLVVLLSLSAFVGLAQDEEEEEFTTPGALFEVEGEYTMATVVKLTGIAWFDRMETGIAWLGEDYPTVTAFQQGPAQADAALQIGRASCRDRV